MGRRLRCFLPAQDLSLELTAIAPWVMTGVKVYLKVEGTLIKPIIPDGHESKVREILFAGWVAVATFQTSGLACLQGYGNSRLPEATSYRRQPILKVYPL